MKAARSDARNITACATSSGLPARLSATRSTSWALLCGVLTNRFIIAVSIGPGATAFTVIDREPTSPEIVHRARQQALAAGLKYVYEGNILTRDGGNTQCPECRRTLIRRTWHRIEEIAIEQGRCRYCNSEIEGEFD